MSSLSITDLVSRIKNNLEESFHSLCVEGEVSNLSRASSGHFYFTLSDENSSLSCALFRFDAQRNPLINKIKNGDKIKVFGSISVYQKRGTFQLIAKQVSPIGKGNLNELFEKLKAKLQKEGLFSDEHKNAIPRFPKKIALITAQQGAALQDFLNITKNKALQYNITIIPTLVQGENAHNDIMRSIDKAESLDNLDLIILMRGGGSIEDLWCFNNEELARKVHGSAVPIISAVGHQTDFTLVDFVSDLRVETPSAAAEYLVTRQVEVSQRLKVRGKELLLHLVQKVSKYKAVIERASPRSLLNILRSKRNSLEKHLKSINFAKKSMRAFDTSSYHMNLDDLTMKMSKHLLENHQKASVRLDQSRSLLSALNPENVLTRGYSILKNDKGVVSTFKDFNNQDIHTPLSIVFHDGEGKVKKV